MKEPGNASGVARITFPPTPGIFNLFYVRTTGERADILGNMKIEIPTPGADPQAIGRSLMLLSRLYPVSEASVSRESSYLGYSYGRFL